MAKQDFQIIIGVRRLLSRHKIDLDKVRYTCAGGTLSFEGTLTSLNSRETNDISLEVLEGIERHVRRMEGLRQVVWRLDNLIKLPEGWSYITAGSLDDKNKAKEPTTQSTGRASPNLLDKIEELGPEEEGNVGEGEQGKP